MWSFLGERTCNYCITSIGQMADDRVYRLGQYKIIEKGDGTLWWESYGGLSTVRRGKCFIEGDILFLGANVTRGHGYLLLEFKEHLDQLSRWEKTKYYCPSYTLYSCKTGKRCLLAKQEKELEKRMGRIRNNVSSRGTKGRRGKAKQSAATEVITRIKVRAAGTLAVFRNWSSRIRS